jgi:hypothetical protein
MPRIPEPRSPETVARPPEATPRPERPADFRDIAALAGAQRPIRPVIARVPPPRSPTAERRQLTNLIDTAGPSRGPKPKPAEGLLRARAEGAPPAQPTGSVRSEQQALVGMKVLPASCWSGGASRWRWWQSRHDTPCK